LNRQHRKRDSFRENHVSIGVASKSESELSMKSTIWLANVKEKRGLVKYAKKTRRGVQKLHEEEKNGDNHPTTQNKGRDLFKGALNLQSATNLVIYAFLHGLR